MTGMESTVPVVSTTSALKWWTWREQLGLPQPGLFENVQRDVSQSFATNHLFEGGRFELQKMLAPSFQVSHVVQMGGQPHQSNHIFLAVHANDKMHLQGQIDGNGDVNARYHFSPIQGLAVRTNTSLPGPLARRYQHSPLLQIESDYSGQDYTLSVKSINMSPWTGTGTWVVSYLQSLTKYLSAGVEYMEKRQFLMPGRPLVAAQGNVTAALRYKTPDWCAHLTATQGGRYFQLGYMHRVAHRQVTLATECEYHLTQGAQTTVGLHLDLFMSQLRLQLDTMGKTALAVQHRLIEGLSLEVAAQVDHTTRVGTFGVGLQFMQ